MFTNHKTKFTSSRRNRSLARFDHYPIDTVSFELNDAQRFLPSVLGSNLQEAHENIPNNESFLPALQTSLQEADGNPSNILPSPTALLESSHQEEYENSSNHLPTPSALLTTLQETDENSSHNLPSPTSLDSSHQETDGNCPNVI